MNVAGPTPAACIPTFATRPGQIASTARRRQSQRGIYARENEWHPCRSSQSTCNVVSVVAAPICQTPVLTTGEPYWTGLGRCMLSISDSRLSQSSSAHNSAWFAHLQRRFHNALARGVLADSSWTSFKSQTSTLGQRGSCRAHRFASSVLIEHRHAYERPRAEPVLPQSSLNDR